MMRSLALALLLGLAACGDDADPAPAPSTPAPTGKGSLALRFSVPDNVRNDDRLKTPLKGVIYGDIFLTEDVGVTGPRKDAKALASVELKDVDLITATESIPWKGEALEPGKYSFLGMFDINGNGAETHAPDAGDLVTLPTKKIQFEISADKETAATIPFELLYN